MSFYMAKNCEIIIDGEAYLAKNFKIIIDGEVYMGGSEEPVEALAHIATKNAEAERAFNACVVYDERRTVFFDQITYRYRCVKHLWSVEGPDKEAARQQAIHYLQQYWSDGEYKDLVGNTEGGEKS
jgi:uncharacterized protein YegP (UPF0339 family)